jgi:5'(3')-deoxyribonucleotidase
MTNWEFEATVKYPETLRDILTEEHFFSRLPQLGESVEYLTKLMEKDAHVVFLTQPPRRSDYALRDKRRWIANNFPKFDLSGIIFAHYKYMVFGDLLMDDNPAHLNSWREFISPHKPIVTATIDYKYNQDCQVDWRFEKETACKDFYEKVCSYYNL